MVFSLTSSFFPDYAFTVPAKQGSGLASRVSGGQPPMSGFFTSVVHDRHPFMGGSCGEPKGSPVLTRYANLHESAHPIGVGRAETLNRFSQEPHHA